MSTTSNQPPKMDLIVERHRGLAILKALQRENGHSSNEEVMAEWLRDLSLGGTRAVLREELDRLTSLAVLKTEWRGFNGETLVFWLTEHGLDYLEFRTQVEALPRIGPGTNPY